MAHIGILNLEQQLASVAQVQQITQRRQDYVQEQALVAKQDLKEAETKTHLPAAGAAAVDHHHQQEHKKVVAKILILKGVEVARWSEQSGGR